MPMKCPSPQSAGKKNGDFAVCGCASSSSTAARADHAELGAALGVREADRSFLGVEPLAPEPQPLEPPEACQQEQADRGKSGRMLARRLGGAHGLPELCDLGAAQAPVARRAGEAAHALPRIGLDLPEADGVLEDGMECRHRAGGDALATGGGAAAAAGARLRGLASGDIGLGALDIAEGQRADLARAEQRLDVRLDPAAVHREGRGLDRPAPPAKDPSRLGLGQIPVA